MNKKSLKILLHSVNGLAPLGDGNPRVQVPRDRDGCVNGLAPLGDGNTKRLPGHFNQANGRVNGLAPLGDGNIILQSIIYWLFKEVLMALPH